MPLVVLMRDTILECGCVIANDGTNYVHLCADGWVTGKCSHSGLN